MFLRKIVAFIKKDFLIQMSYRLHFILNWLGILIQVGIFYFIAKLFGKSTTLYLKEYGGEYFPFVLIGLAFSGYFMTALQSFATSIREEQMMGTLEATLLTPTKISTLIISLPCWDFIFASINIFIYLLLGICFLGVRLSNVDVFAVFIILLLTIISFSSIGMLSAAFIMVFKKGDPITWAIGMSSAFFGGAYFPITILPQKLKVISYFLPITYSLRSLRYALLQGYTYKMLLFDIATLLLFCIILLPLSIWAFKYAVRKAKLAGTLAYY